MPIGISGAPDVLPRGGKEIYRSAFNNAYDTTCKKREDRDACAAKIAWSAVKNRYQKQGEKWVEKTFNQVAEEFKLDIKDVPLPASLYDSPVSAAETWIVAYRSKLAEADNVASSANHAWVVLRSAFEIGVHGVWVLKAGMIVRASDLKIEKKADAPEVVKAEPIITRASGGAVNFRYEAGPIIVRDMTYEQEEALLENGYADEEAARPDGYPDWDWANLPWTARTVSAVIEMRRRQRAYLDVADALKKRGWTAYPNPNWPDELIFQGWKVLKGRAQILQRGVLVHKVHNDGTKSEHWRLMPLSDFASFSTAIRVPPDEVRFRGPVLEMRGGEGSGYHAPHEGLKGTWGGSAPRGGGGAEVAAESKPALSYAQQQKEISEYEKGKKPRSRTDIMKEMDEAVAAGEKARKEGRRQDALDAIGREHELIREMRATMTESQWREFEREMGWPSTASEEAVKEEPKDTIEDELPSMSISEIARVIRKDWGSKVNFAAKPYLEAMRELNSIEDMYFMDSGRSVVSYFLSNAAQWRGERARAVKAELKRRLKG